MAGPQGKPSYSHVARGCSAILAASLLALLLVEWQTPLPEASDFSIVSVPRQGVKWEDGTTVPLSKGTSVQIVSSPLHVFESQTDRRAMVEEHGSDDLGSGSGDFGSGSDDTGDRASGGEDSGPAPPSLPSPPSAPPPPDVRSVVVDVEIPIKLNFTGMKVAQVLAAANATSNSIKDAAGNTANGVTKTFVTTQTMAVQSAFSLTTKMTGDEVCQVVLAALSLANDPPCGAEVSAVAGRRLSKSRRLQASFKAEYTLSFPITDLASLQAGQDATSSANGLTADSIITTAANNVPPLTVVVSAVEPAATSLVVKTVITITKEVDVTNSNQSFEDFESSANSLETISDSIDFDALSDAVSAAARVRIEITASDVTVAVTKTNAPPSMPPPSGPPSPPPPSVPPPPNNTNAGFTLEELIGIIGGSSGGGIILLALALHFWRSKGKGAAKDEDGGFNTTTSQHV